MQYKDKERGTWIVELSYKNSFGKTGLNHKTYGI